MKKKVNYILISVYLFLSISVLCFGCNRLKKSTAIPVQNFDSSKFEGKWYEVARLDHSFEKNLAFVTLMYTVEKDKTINILFEGKDLNTDTWRVAEGHAKFKRSEKEGVFKVSMMKSFYAPIVILAIDSNYHYALVGGGSIKHLWILSRTPKLSEGIKEEYLEKAETYGFDTSDLIWVKQKESNSD